MTFRRKVRVRDLNVSAIVFAHMMIIGTPNNAIAYAMGKDPVTGKQLVTLGDFFRHGFVVLLLYWAVLWGRTILVHWRWIGLH